MLEANGLAVSDATLTHISPEFGDWVRRSGVSHSDAAALRASFLNAAPEARSAFQIESVDGEVRFAWPELIALGIKR